MALAGLGRLSSVETKLEALAMQIVGQARNAVWEASGIGNQLARCGVTIHAHPAVVNVHRAVRDLSVVCMCVYVCAFVCMCVCVSLSLSSLLFSSLRFSLNELVACIKEAVLLHRISGGLVQVLVDARVWILVAVLRAAENFPAHPPITNFSVMSAQTKGT